MDIYTERSERQDLANEAKLSQADLNGYAFPKLFPIITDLERSGVLSYAPVGLTAASGTKGRKNGAALDVTEIKTVDIPWNVARIEGRTKIFASEVKGFGGIEVADKFGGEDAARRVFNTIEKDAYTLVFSTARADGAVSLANRKIRTLISKAAIAKRRWGKAYLVMTTNGVIKFAQIPEVIEAAIGRFGATAINMLNDPDQNNVANAIAILIGFQGIILFDSEIVGNDKDDYIAVAALRPELFGADNMAVRMGIKRMATYAFTMIYLPDPANPDTPFSMKSHPNDMEKANYYDAECFSSLNEIHATDGAEPANPNGGAIALFKMLADANGYTGAPVQVVNPPPAP